jgi:hypothetical protein
MSQRAGRDRFTPGNKGCREERIKPPQHGTGFTAGSEPETIEHLSDPDWLARRNTKTASSNISRAAAKRKPFLS